MEFLGLALAVIGFGLAIAVWMRSTKMQQQAAAAQAELEKRISRQELRASLAESEKEQVRSRAAVLERELAAAVARRDEKAMARALWELELERSYRQWRDVVVPSDASRSGSVNEGQKLTFAVANEVDRLREEVGVAIRFDGALDLPLDPEIALGALRICEELLAMAAKSSDEVVVSMDQGEEPSLTIVLTCAGWEDVDSGDVKASLQKVARRLDGWLRWEEGQDGEVSVELKLPATAPEPESPSATSLTSADIPSATDDVTPGATVEAR